MRKLPLTCIVNGLTHETFTSALTSAIALGTACSRFDAPAVVLITRLRSIIERSMTFRMLASS